MKKRLIAVVVAVCALAVLAIGSTFAFFTSNDNAGNTFTMGNVKIKLTEESTDANGDKTGAVERNNEGDGKGITYTGALPGDTFSKEPTVTNTGDNTAWVRVKISVTSPEAAMAENVLKLKEAIEQDMIDNFGWARKVGDTEYLYFTTPVEKGKTADLFETVSIPNTWGNEAADAHFSIAIKAEAVQYDNNGATWDAAEWIGDFEN